MADFEIFVFILGDSPASDNMFSIIAQEGTSVSAWKELVYAKKQNSLKGYDAASLILWKLKQAIPLANVDQEVIWPLGHDFSGIAEKMLPAKKLSHYFPSPPMGESLHVIAVLPSLPSAGEKHGRLSEDSGGESPFKRKRGPRHSGSKDVVTSDKWCERQDTVSGILELLHKEHLVQVRGTPASGKTTLLNLLHARIVKEHPNAQVFIQKAWPQKLMKENTGRIAEYLPGYPSFENGERYFLFDEGQTTYWDELLLKEFKDSFQSSDKSVYAILFCSYGNEDISDPQSVTPVHFGDGRVTLNRSNRSLSKPCGLLLDVTEFHQVISLRSKIRLTDDLRDFIYHFTQGHVGAVVAVVTFLLTKRESSMLSGANYCLEDFRQDTASYDEFCMYLSMDHGIARGMPRKSTLHLYARAMRALLYHESIPSDDDILLKDVDKDIREKLQEGYKRGFVNKDEADRYTFASPLHQQLWSWLLVPQPDYQLPFQDIFSFVKDTVSKFRPSQLDASDRRVGSASHRPPEAQYQEEYYRCVHSLTKGNVRISPEYAAAAGSRSGRIDFFIPSKKWGIELTREGSKLAEHNSRFATDGAYGQWLGSSDMEDYILLDFRSTMPSRRYPGIDKLYFVVFNNEKTCVEIYDKNLTLQHSRNLTQQC